MDTINIRISAGVRYGHKLYFSELYINGLFCLDLNSRKISFLKNFAHEKSNFMLFRSAYLYRNTAWFLPWRSRFIVKVNLDTLEMEYFRIPFRKKNKEAEQELNIAFLSTGVIAERYLYLVPVNYDMVLLIDMEKSKIKAYEHTIDIEKSIYTLGTVVEKILWMFPYKGTHIAKLNLETGELKYDKWEYENHLFTGVEYINKCIWCSPDREEDVICISVDSMQEDRIEIPKSMKEDLKFNIICHENEIWLLPSKARRLISIDMRTHFCKEWNEEDGIDINEQYGIRKLYKMQNELAFSTTKSVILFETEKRQFTSIPLQMEKSKFLKSIEMGNECMKYKESEFIIEEYIGVPFFAKEMLNDQKNLRIEQNIGQIIWNLTKELDV